MSAPGDSTALRLPAAIGRLAGLAWPATMAMAVAYGLARYAPYWVIGVNRWLWWFAVFGIANTCLVFGDKIRSRYSVGVTSGRRATQVSADSSDFAARRRSRSP